MNWYKKSNDEIDEIEEIEEIDLTDSNNWTRNNYEWNCGDYMIDNDIPTEQFEIYYKDQYIDREDTFEEAMERADDYKNGYAEAQEKKELTPYDIIEAKFGYTDNPTAAGYIMADGQMVNLNRPNNDHREVTVDGSTKGMQEFIAEGNIRLSFQDGYAFFDIKKKPTMHQLRVMKDILEEANNGAEVSMDNGLQEYDDRRTSYYSSDDAVRKQFDAYPDGEAVMGEVNAFFRGVQPSQFARFLNNDSWYKTAQNGEWWIIDGQAIYADSDTGDIGHEAYVIEMVRSQIAEELGYWNLPEYYDWDEVKQEIVKNMIKDGTLDGDEAIKKYGDEYIEKIPYNTDTFDSIAMEEGVEKIKLDVADNAMDARDYGMKELGWKRVEGKHVQTQTLTSSDLYSIYHGLDDAYGQDDNIEDMVFTIEVRNTNKTYWNIPFSVIEEGKPVAVARYGGSGAYQYAGMSKKRIYKTAQNSSIMYYVKSLPHEILLTPNPDMATHENKTVPAFVLPMGKYFNPDKFSTTITNRLIDKLKTQGYLGLIEGDFMHVFDVNKLKPIGEYDFLNKTIR